MGRFKGLFRGGNPDFLWCCHSRLNCGAILKEVEAVSVVWADVLGLVGCTRAGSKGLCDVGLRDDLDRGGNVKQ